MKRLLNQLKAKPLSYHIGNLFILFSLVGFFVTFYPIIQAYLFPTTLEQLQISADSGIFIPKIHAAASIIPNVDPFNEAEYTQALRHGVAQAKNTSLPPKKGLTYLFAHSSGNPWELSRTNTLFLRIGELKKNDEITILHNKQRFFYKVREIKTVWPNEVKYLLDTKRNQLILQTCAPLGTSLMRLLVFADPV